MYKVTVGERNYVLHFGYNVGQWGNLNGKRCQRNVTLLNVYNENGEVINTSFSVLHPNDEGNRLLGKLYAIKVAGNNKAGRNVAEQVLRQVIRKDVDARCNELLDKVFPLSELLDAENIVVEVE